MSDDELPPDVPVEEVARPATKLERAAGVAQAVLRHKQLLVAGMEVLREKAAMTPEEEKRIVTAFEQGTATARAALSELVEKLQQAKVGRVVVPILENIRPEDLTAANLKQKAMPALRLAKDQVMTEARPYLERAKARLAELKVLEEPALQRLEAISMNFRDAGKEVAVGLRGAGKEAANELVKRGKTWWMSAETEEMEREFFDWVMRSLPRAQRSLVHFLLGFGIILLVGGVLLAAQEFGVFQELAVFVGIALLISLGLLLINWGIKTSEAMRTGRGEIERLARMTPTERRVFLAKKWAARAQAEGVIDSEEARVVIEETIRALPEEEVPTQPPTTLVEAQLPKSP